MTLLQPYMLWGMLAVAIPVAIHFWYQKRGRTVEWAAMRWLGEQTTLQHRGLRLNEVWLLLLRCLIVLLLAFVLGKPIMEWFGDQRDAEVVHLVQPDALVTETYRFELEKALERGEKIFWLGTKPERLTNIATLPASPGSLSSIQQNVNELSDGLDKDFKLYIHNDPAPTTFQKTYIPGSYELFIVADSSVRRQITHLDNKQAGSKRIQVLLENSGAGEQHTIQAALAALSEVYGFLFEIAEQQMPGKHYDWVFTNRSVTRPDAGTRYIVSGRGPEWDAPASVIFLPDSLRPATSELVESGQFPEWLGEMLVKDLNLAGTGPLLSEGQLQALFERTDAAGTHQEAAIRPWLLSSLLLLLILERWLALRKTAGGNG